MNTKKFGLIGRNISYSFSKAFFEARFHELHLEDHAYSLFDIPNIESIAEIFNIKEVQGLNVTQPYKISIIPFLDDLSPEAEKIGAVNTVLIKNGKRTGYNTDAYGFEKSLAVLKDADHKKALILGNGGAAKAVIFVFEKLKIPYKIISRKGELNFLTLTAEMVREHQIIIQCTPVGTYPNVSEHLEFPFSALTEEHFVLDLIYNPEQTEFLRKAGAFGAKTMNGKYMLEQQAEKSWQIWNS